MSTKTPRQVSQQRMAIVFNTWAQRYRESPDSFDELLDDDGNVISDYGQRCARHFESIADELDADGKLPTMKS